MSEIASFEDVQAWQKSRELTIVIYKTFKTSRDYSFRDQIQRASVSVMNNIAEGFERRSNKELKHLLFVAKGSCGEVRSMLRLATDIKYVSQQDSAKLINLSTEISKMLSGFIKKL